MVSLLNDFASEMIYPLLPAFVIGVLGGGALSLGALDGAADFTAALVKFASGRLADAPRRRGGLIVLGYFVAVLVRPVIALTGAVWQVIGLRVTDRVGKGIRTPPRDALIADVTPVELHGRAFGLQRGLDHAGAVLGPLAAWALLSSGKTDLRGVIGASLVPGILVLILAAWAVKDGNTTGGYDGRINTGAGGQPLPAAVAAQSRPRFPPALLAIATFYLLRMPETLMLLRSQQVGISVVSVLLLWAALHVVRSSTSFLGGWLSDRIGAGRTMWLGWISYAAIAYGFARAATPAAAWGLFLALGVVAGLTESPERALVSRLAGPKQGTGFGIYHGLTGLAALVGGLVLGALYQGSGASPAFLVSAAAALALAVAALPLGYLTMEER